MSTQYPAGFFSTKNFVHYLPRIDVQLDLVWKKTVYSFGLVVSLLVTCHKKGAELSWINDLLSQLEDNFDNLLKVSGLKMDFWQEHQCTRLFRNARKVQTVSEYIKLSKIQKNFWLFQSVIYMVRSEFLKLWLDP